MKGTDERKSMEEDMIIAMAVAAIAEETKQDIKNIRVKSFKEVGKSPLERYIEEKGLRYRKYQLGD